MQGFDISFITGIMLGMELVEDEDFSYLFFDLLFFRLTFFKEKE